MTLTTKHKFPENSPTPAKIEKVINLVAELNVLTEDLASDDIQCNFDIVNMQRMGVNVGISKISVTIVDLIHP